MSTSPPQEFDWSSKDWDGTKAKTKEDNNLLTDWNTPKPQTDIDHKMDADELAISKLQIRQNDPKEELVDMTDLLVLSPTTKAPEDMGEKNDSDELSKVERKQQQEEEKYVVYQRTYIGQLSEEKESKTESDNSGYSYFG